MKYLFEDDMDEIGNEISDKSNDQKDFLTLEKVIYRVNRDGKNTSFPFVVYILPVCDNDKEKHIFLNYFQLQTELYQANRTTLGKDKIVCLASFDSSEEFVIKDEVEYRKLLKVAKETNNSIKFWFEMIPFESNKLVNINKKFDDLFIKKKEPIQNSLKMPSSYTIFNPGPAVNANNQTNSITLKPNATVKPKATTIINPIKSDDNQINNKPDSKKEYVKINWQNTKPTLQETTAKDVDSKIDFNFRNEYPLIYPNIGPLNKLESIVDKIQSNIKTTTTTKSSNQQGPSVFIQPPSKEFFTKLLSTPSTQQANSKTTTTSVTLKSTNNDNKLENNNKKSELPSFINELVYQTSLLDIKMGKLKNKVDQMESSLIKKPVETKEKQQQQTSNENKNQIIHHNIYCDHCDKNIVGIRYKCMVCLDYDLCDKCEKIEPFVHIVGHNFIKAKTPIEIANLSAPLNISPNNLCAKLTVFRDPPTRDKQESKSELKQRAVDLDSSEYVKKKKRKYLTLKEKIHARKYSTEKVDDKLIANSSNKLISDDEKTFNYIKELHDNILSEIEPEIKRRTAYYVKSFKSLSNLLLKQRIANEDEDEDYCLSNEINKLTIRSQTNSNRFSNKLAKIERVNELLAKPLQQNSKLLSSNDSMITKLNLTKKEESYRESLIKYIKFVEQLSNNKEFLSSIEFANNDQKYIEKALINKVNSAFFAKFLLIVDTEKQKQTSSKLDSNKEKLELENDLDYILSFSPIFSTEYNIHFNEFLKQIYKGRFEKEDQLINNYKLNCIKIAKEEAVLSNFYDQILDDSNCAIIAKRITSEAYFLTMAKMKVSNSIDKRNLLQLSPQILVAPNNSINETVVSDKLDCVSVPAGPSENNETEKIDNGLQEKEVAEQRKEEAKLQQILNSFEQQEKKRKEKEQENIKALIEQQEAMQQQETEQEKIKDENVNTTDQQNEEILKDDLINYSDISSAASTASELEIPSISVEKLDKEQQLEKKTNLFVNIELDKENDDAKSNCSTIKSSESSSSSSSDSMDSYEMIMSDSFDFEKHTDNVIKPADKKLNDDQSVIAVKSTASTNLSKDENTELMTSQLMNSSRTSIYKSLIDPSTSTIEDQQSTINNQQPQSKSDVFDFNNWTYLLGNKNSNESQNSSKSTDKLLDEFYDICKNEYGLPKKDDI